MSQPITDLELAVKTLAEKRRRYEKKWTYYEGRESLRWSVEKLEEVFGETTCPRWIENWSAVIVDSVLDRLQLERMAVIGEDDVTDQINDIFMDTELDLDACDVHKDAVITGEGYVIAWKRDGVIEAFHNDSRMVHLFKDPSHPHTDRFAAKWWLDDDGFVRMVLYYPGRIDQYIGTKNTKALPSRFKQQRWEFVGTDANSFGVIPVFQFSLDKRGQAELDNVMDLQDVVNKTLSDMMVAAEFQSVPQRWMISQADYNTEGDQGTPNRVPYSPFSTVMIPATDTDSQPAQTGTYQAADLRMFLDVIEKKARAMAIITRTPKHYLMMQAGDPSGEALLAMEAPLTRKIQHYQKRLSPTWRKLSAFLLKLDKTDTDSKEIKALWEMTTTVQPVTQANARLANTNAGIPIHNQLRDEGWTEKQLSELDKDARRVSAVAETGEPGTTTGSSDTQQAGATKQVVRTTANMIDISDATVEKLADAIAAAIDVGAVVSRAKAQT